MGMTDYLLHGIPETVTVNGYSVEHRDWWRLPTENKLRALRLEVARSLPKLWFKAIEKLAIRAGRDAWSQCNVYIHWLYKYAGAKSADMSESDLRDKAERYAKLGTQEDFGRVMRDALPSEGTAAMLAMWEHVEAFVIKRLGAFKCNTINGMAMLRGLWKRLECASWWRRQLRRMVARAYESGCFELGLIGAKFGTWYASDRAVVRRKQQNAANAAMMAASSIRNEAGQVMTLADVASRSVSNKTNRRNELMTRIRGCEEWADSQGLVGLFTTNTLPSRFHSNLHGGGKNPKYEGLTPEDGQKWLCETWAGLRAKWARDGVQVMGYRVAEPHHDGCVHWHMLLWCKPEDVEAVKWDMLVYWTRSDFWERGVLKNRIAIKEMIGGQAAGYVAKYIAKNIDGHMVDQQFDLTAGGSEKFVGSEYIQGEKITPSMRVEAWATLWHIRQFQPIGQPPVTVWRELRKVDKAAAAGGSDTFIHAWLAVHRDKARGRVADWAAYMKAQGGAMLQRKDYRLCSHTIDKVKAGRYEVVSQAWACGVRDKLDSGAVPTKRVAWVKEGAGAVFAFGRKAPTWTRLNNCTHPNKTGHAPTLDAVRKDAVWDREARYSRQFEGVGEC